MRYNTEFEKYAVQHCNIGSSNLDYYKKQVNGSLTPYILEERELRVTQMDIFSRLMLDRILFLYGQVNDNMASIVQAQLLFLDSVNNNDIKLQISSPGGSVLSGLGIYDMMKYVSSDIETINMGLSASMGSILLSSGTKGKRHSLKHSRVMLHTVSSGAEGKLQDMQISFKEAEKYNDLLFDILSDNTNKSKDDILKDSDRDFWLNSKESLEYGLIDNIIEKKDIKK